MRGSYSVAAKATEDTNAVAARVSSHDGEIALSEKVVDISFKANKGMPTAAQQEALIIKYRLKARKLGRSILRGWHARLDLEEVDSLVDLSLCEAVRRFNPNKGASFMTFLYYHLKGNLVRAVANAAASHSIPVCNVDEAEVARGERDHFVGFQHRNLSSSEVAEALCSQEVPTPDEVLWKKELNDCSAIACDKLDTLEREIIKRIFVHEQQIMDIASSLGYSRCHISRVKKRALETLYDELRVAMNVDDLGVKPTFDEDEVEVERRIADRRAIHRRRPRSKSVRAQAFAAARAA